MKTTSQSHLSHLVCNILLSTSIWSNTYIHICVFTHIRTHTNTHLPPPPPATPHTHTHHTLTHLLCLNCILRNCSNVQKKKKKKKKKKSKFNYQGYLHIQGAFKPINMAPSYAVAGRSGKIRTKIPNSTPFYIKRGNMGIWVRHYDGVYVIAWHILTDEVLCLLFNNYKPCHLR